MSHDVKKHFHLFPGIIIFVSLYLFQITQLECKETIGFPRLMGMNIGKKNYEDVNYQNRLAKLDIVILGFTPGWGGKNSSEKIQQVVRNLKAINSNILVGQYTILNESYIDGEGKYKAHNDKISKIGKEGWWLRNGSGNRVRWSAKYNTYEVNFLRWAKPDSEGKRYPEWIAARDFNLFFKPVPELDIWYFDNVMVRPRISNARWKLNGIDQLGSDHEIISAYRKAHVEEWREARRLDNKLLLMGNADNDLSSTEYSGKLQGVFLEGLMGKWWSIEARSGWHKMMRHYFTASQNTSPPHIVGFNVAGSPANKRFFRYAFTSCLMGNGYFSFTDKSKGYSDVPWFDEYDIELGKALESQRLAPWVDGVFKREFENGVVLVNSSSSKKSITLNGVYDVQSTNKHVITKINVDSTVLSLSAKDGIILTKVIR